MFINAVFNFKQKFFEKVLFHFNTKTISENNFNCFLSVNIYSSAQINYLIYYLILYFILDYGDKKYCNYCSCRLRKDHFSRSTFKTIWYIKKNGWLKFSHGQ